MTKVYECGKCGNEVADSHKFCANCGSQFDSESGTPPKQEDYDKMAEVIKGALSGITTDNYFRVSTKLTLGLGVQIDYFNGKDKTEWPNGISMNDPGHFTAFVFPVESSYKNGFKQSSDVTFEITNRAYQIPKTVKVSKKTGSIEVVQKYAIDKLTMLIGEAQKLGKK